MDSKYFNITVVLILVFCPLPASGSDCKQKLDVVAVLDGSGSIASDDFVKLKNAAIQLAEDLNLGPNDQRFGALVFSTTVTNTVPLSTNVQSLRSRISSIQQVGGGASTHLGIQAMTQMFNSRNGTKKVGIVITDGRSNSEVETINAAKAAKNAGITMFAVGVGSASNLNKNELNAIATTSSNVVYLDNFGALKTKFKSLIKKICLVDGGWTSWTTTSRSSCSATCGGGAITVRQSRNCTNPEPEHDGQPCNGSETNVYTVSCNTFPCPTDGGWTSWTTTSRSSCSATCGGGAITVRQSRNCTNPEPEHDGQPCNGSETNVYTVSCNTFPCPTDGGWTSWTTTSRSSCSATCGGGAITVRQSRNCTNPEPEHDGQPCNGSETNVYTVSCNTFPCPTDGGWTSWTTTSRSSCSATCGGGAITVRQSRNCTNPEPEHDGQPCNGSETNVYTVSCNTFPCPIDGGWTSWTTTSRSSCSATCGGGAITVRQSRNCTNPEPEHDGQPCNGSETNVYTVSCNTFPCPTYDGCQYENGIGFLPHPTDCRFFVQCIGWGASYHIKQCPPGLYWNQKDLTCALSSTVNCTTTATAVPPEDSVVTVAPPSAPDALCVRKAVPRKPSVYSENVPGHGWLNRNCAPGTVFNNSTCSCVHGGSVPLPECQEEIYLPLHADLEDHSKHNLYIENSGVKITKGGQASFANNAVLRIHRFSNMDFGKTLDLSFVLHKGGKPSKNQAVVTNAECKNTGSIYIIQKASAIEFRVRNQKGVFAGITIPGTKATSRISLTIHKGVMTGSVNGVQRKTPFKGRIGRVHCGLQIGRGTGYDSFNGLLEEFKLSLCKP